MRHSRTGLFGHDASGHVTGFVRATVRLIRQDSWGAPDGRAGRSGTMDS